MVEPEIHGTIRINYAKQILPPAPPPSPELKKPEPQIEQPSQVEQAPQASQVAPQVEQAPQVEPAESKEKWWWVLRTFGLALFFNSTNISAPPSSRSVGPQWKL
jgi:hypothetical protein